ncbi:hypothetical protein HRG_006144 [Hirsutella rhossiliensis]|uniref:Uncharacterized protein n=1 Tax=Hirsutella rhossiliensis TaxID=111463 RepID=A0A9P8SIX1_9HYPO|nr:uncharacterized protein HRG_06144 [Hirsutella rhossiliensis]KAH0963634.1 hypothetical protein HRG_06144 [Hirsutella rhossiliensis]
MKAFAAILAACLASGALAASEGGAAASRMQAADGSLGAPNDAQDGMMDSKGNVRRAEMRGKKKRKKRRV